MNARAQTGDTSLRGASWLELEIFHLFGTSLCLAHSGSRERREKLSQPRRCSRGVKREPTWHSRWACLHAASVASLSLHTCNPWHLDWRRSRRVVPQSTLGVVCCRDVETFGQPTTGKPRGFGLRLWPTESFVIVNPSMHGSFPNGDLGRWTSIGAFGGLGPDVELSSRWLVAFWANIVFPPPFLSLQTPWQRLFLESPDELWSQVTACRASRSGVNRHREYLLLGCGCRCQQRARDAQTRGCLAAAGRSDMGFTSCQEVIWNGILL